MKQIRSTKDVKQLGTILGVWAHPDDETFTCGALMAAAIENGQEVICLTATKGEAGVQDEARWPAKTLGDTRAKELEAALKVLGVRNHFWLEYKDGCCWEADTDEAVGCICEYIERFRPDTILTFGPEGMTGHPDHQSVCTWANLACRESNPRPTVYHAVLSEDQYKKLKPLDRKLDVFFNISRPPIRAEADCQICFEPSSEQRSKKYQALLAMPSQYAMTTEQFDETTICEALSPECFVRSGS